MTETDFYNYNLECPFKFEGCCRPLIRKDERGGLLGGFCGYRGCPFMFWLNKNEELKALKEAL